MPRKYFRRFLPDPETIRKNRFVAVFGSALRHPNLWHLNRRSAAGGVAVGMFCGLIPGPFQMLTAALLAVVLKVNLPVAAMTTWYTNPITIVPLYYAAYRLGKWVTGGGTTASVTAAADLRFDNLREWLPMLWDWIQTMGEPFVIGLVLLALILAAVAYVGVLAAWRVYVVLAWRQRQRRRRRRA